MQAVVHFLTGNVRIEVICPYPERLMNVCAHNDISFWDLVRIDPVTVEMSMRLKSFQKLLPLLENIGATAKKKRQKGAPVLFRRMRKRYVLLSGLLLTLIATWVLSLYIWEIEIEGNTEVSSIEILQVLDDLGMGIGSFSPNIDPVMLRHMALLELEDISWLTVNVQGSRARVIVRERMWAPDMFDEGEKTAVYAMRSGVIEQMFIWDGTSLVEEGQVVEVGQDLITGRMESVIGETWFTRADAEIYARTWYEMSLSMPLSYLQREHTGETWSKRTIIIGNWRINLFFDSGISWGNYDKIINRHELLLPGGILLPLSMERRVYLEYTLVSGEFDPTYAALILQERLLKQLEELLLPGGQIIRTDFEVSVSNGMISVYMQAEAREQIAALRRLTEEERVVIPPAQQLQEAT